MFSVCSCAPGAHANDSAGSAYYVTIQDAGRSAFVAGPYASHGEAEADLELVRNLGEALDPRAVWYAWGTARADAGTDVGKQQLNQARDEEKSRRVRINRPG